MGDDSTESREREALETIRFLSAERDRHVELLEKLNFRVSFGAVVVLATALFGADDLGSVGAALGEWRVVVATLVLAGAALIIAGLVIHWNVYDKRASWCAEAMWRTWEEKHATTRFRRVKDPFAMLPRRPHFSWLLALGVIAVLASGSILVWTALVG